MKYRIGYCRLRQWRYYDVVGELKDAMESVEGLFKTGFTRVTIKLLKSEV